MSDMYRTLKKARCKFCGWTGKRKYWNSIKYSLLWENKRFPNCDRLEVYWVDGLPVYTHKRRTR